MIGCAISFLFDSNNLPYDLCQHSFACCCCCFQRLKYRQLLQYDDHGDPLFVLSLLGSHDSVSLCVILLNKIRFVYDFVIIQIY